MIPAFLRPFLAALLMVPLLSLAGWATAHGIDITDEQVHKAVDYLCEVAIPVLAGLAVITRRLIDKKANPANTASSHLAVDGKFAAAGIKRAEKRAERADSQELPRRAVFHPPADAPPEQD